MTSFSIPKSTGIKSRLKAPNKTLLLIAEVLPMFYSAELLCSTDDLVAIISSLLCQLLLGLLHGVKAPQMQNKR